MNKETFLASGLLEQYALGITSEDENKVVEGYLQNFPEVRQEYTNMRKALDQYAQRYATQPPEVLRSKVMGAIDDQSMQDQDYNEPIPGKGSRRLTSQSYSRYLSYGALLIMAVSLFFLNQNRNQLERTLNEKTEALAKCQESNSVLQESSGLFAFIQHQATHTVLLNSTGNVPRVRALAYWNPAEEKAMINASQLPAPPQGKQYQVWADVHGEMVSVGLLALKEHSERLTRIQFVPEATSLNITIEPLGGSEKPNVSSLLVNGKI